MHTTPNQLTNQANIVQKMQRLGEAILKNRRELRTDASWVLHQDNAPCHSALVLRDHFAKNLTHIVPQRDLASCDLLFPKLKRPFWDTVSTRLKKLRNRRAT